MKRDVLLGGFLFASGAYLFTGCVAPPSPEQGSAWGKDLITAILRHDEAQAKALISRGADVNARWGMQEGEESCLLGHDRWTPLHAAAKTGNAELTRILIQEGAEPAVDDGYGATPLMFALASSSQMSEECALLLIRAGAPVDSRQGTYIDDYGEAGTTPLHLAARRQAHAALKLLLLRGAPVHAKTSYGWTAMHLAKDMETTRILKKAGADLDALDYSGHTPLARAIAYGDEPQALLFVEAGADIETRCRDGTVLTEAAKEQWPRLVSRLLDKGADPNRWKLVGESPLDIVLDISTSEAEEIALSLLKAGADIPVAEGVTEDPVTRVVRAGHRRLLENLISRGIDVRKADEEGWTPLHQACFSRPDLKVVELLLKAGADPSAKTFDGRTPVECLPEHARPAIQPLLQKPR